MFALIFINGLLNSLSAQLTPVGNNVYFNNSGNVGIGTSNPGEKLSVIGNIFLGGTTPKIRMNDRAVFQMPMVGETDYVRTVIGQNIQWDNTDKKWQIIDKVYNDFAMLRLGSNADIAFYNKPINAESSDLSNQQLENFRRFTININGNVGIGTSNPEYKLSVIGDIYGSGYLRVGSMPSSPNWQFTVLGQRAIGAVEASNNRAAYLYAANDIYGVTAFDFNTGTPLPLVLNLGTNHTLISPYGGNVGIGTTTPQSKLAVNGDITAKKVRVSIDGWPDYVFDSSYALRPIVEVESFIKKNKHLPDVPSAAEVVKNGLDVGEVQATLLKKIEELSMYIIELNHKNGKLNDQVKSLEEKLNNLERQILD
ncbi:hypothetical protein KJS94_12375 [Flavihumibacter rivuli]|uniref:hypothetical protein n=1 Tax=Flavihumibacter rivuli TaxID=2838156 RepID=UPI001BDDE482|nr:hypothetical protein [Flavihumibacter rivuli]ULQ55438.1 hypothetical protein KJS94_12375 [Flavihumibacter rivuli]